MKSILEDLDDAAYYGSDHEEREKEKGGGGAGAQETVEDELARLVSYRAAAGGYCGPLEGIFDVSWLAVITVGSCHVFLSL